MIQREKPVIWAVVLNGWGLMLASQYGKGIPLLIVKDSEKSIFRNLDTLDRCIMHSPRLQHSFSRVIC